MLLTWHNIQYYQDLMAGMRAAIAEASLVRHSAEVRATWAQGEPR